MGALEVVQNMGLGTTVLAAVAVILATFVLPSLVRSFMIWKALRHIPSPPWDSLIFGHLPGFLSDKAPEIMASYSEKYGPTFRLRILWYWQVIVSDHKRVQQVLQKSTTYIPKERRVYGLLEVATEPRMQNIVTASDGEYWKAVRQAWMKCLTSVNLKRILPTVVDVSERMAGHLAAGTGPAAPTPGAAAAAPAAAGASPGSSAGVPVNMSRMADGITLDVIGKLLYDKDFRAVENQCGRYLELVSHMLEIIHQSSHPWMAIMLALAPKKTKAIRTEWDQMNTALAKEAMEHPPPENTIAGQLLQVVDPATCAPLTTNQLKAEMVLATIAGFETTSNAVTWALGMLATHTTAMARLEQELNSVGLLATPLTPTPRSFSWSDLSRLPYLLAVIREALRLFAPAAQGSFRLTTRDVDLGDGLKIPAGVAVGVPLYALGRNKGEYGDDADDFKPERWLNAQQMEVVKEREQHGGVAMAAPATSATGGVNGGGGSGSGDDEEVGGSVGSSGRLLDPWTFSIGPRDCAGQALARMELQVVLAVLVGRLHVTLPAEVGGLEGLLARRMFHTTLQIRGGLPLLIKARV